MLVHELICQSYCLFFSSTKPVSENENTTTSSSTPNSTVDAGGSTSGGSGRSKGKAVSDNFIRLNMKMKKFCKRPGRSMTGSAYKRQMWKKRQKQDAGSGVGGAGRGGARKGGRNVCFKCGKPGHWAKNCTDNGGSKNLGKFAGEAVKFDDSLALGREDDVDSDMLEELAKSSPFPTVQEAAMMARGIKVKPKPASSGEQDEIGECEDENADSSDYVAPPPCHTQSTPPPPSVEPLYPLTEDGHVISKILMSITTGQLHNMFIKVLLRVCPLIHTGTPKCVFDTLRKFGYSSFRAGQEEAIMNILSGVCTSHENFNVVWMSLTVNAYSLSHVTIQDLKTSFIAQLFLQVFQH